MDHVCESRRRPETGDGETVKKLRRKLTKTSQTIKYKTRTDTDADTVYKIQQDTKMRAQIPPGRKIERERERGRRKEEGDPEDEDKVPK